MEIPAEFLALRERSKGAEGRAEAEALAALGPGYLDRWELTPDGTPMHGMGSIVQPVRRADGTPAVLKLPLIDRDQPGEAAALRVWDGDAAVRLIAEDPETWVMLLERLIPRDLENF